MIRILYKWVKTAPAFTNLYPMGINSIPRPLGSLK